MNGAPLLCKKLHCVTLPDVGEETAKRQLIDIRLGGRLDELVEERRRAGASWRTIAHEISKASKVKVSFETLRDWFADVERVA